MLLPSCSLLSYKVTAIRRLPAFPIYKQAPPFLAAFTTPETLLYALVCGLSLGSSGCPVSVMATAVS